VLAPTLSVVDCSSVNISFSSNVQVQIKEGGLAGITTAQIKSQEGPAPVLNLGPIEAHEVFRQPGIDGAPLIYKGEGFELSIDTDGASNERGYYSTLNADIDGHVFNNATLYCQLYAHAL
jgi:hypothetical protein